MNLLIIKAINYKNKNKNKKFNNALKAETSEFKFYNKNKNKSEAKPKKPNEMSTPDNTADKKMYINCDYCGRRHPQLCFYEHSESAGEKWRK